MKSITLSPNGQTSQGHYWYYGEMEAVCFGRKHEKEMSNWEFATWQKRV